jgi:YgiT-type zinc finger domain-containing protein
MALGRTIVPYELDQEKVIVVSKVPARICNRCGESFVEMEVVRDLEQVIEKTEREGLSFGIVEYRKAA